MSEKEKLKKRLWNLVHLFDDYIRTGYRTIHPGLQMVCEETEAPAGIAGDALQAKTGISAKEQLEVVRKNILACTNCYLHYNRAQALPGEGPVNPDLFIVGPGPGEDEDTAGKPFYGKAGDYLNKWLKAIDLDISANCFICNIVRCRPPQNRDPRMEEAKTCFPYLDKQILLTKPRIILCLGRISGQVLTGKLATSVDKLRNQPFSFKGIPVIVSYHPDFVLRNQNLRKPVWEDLKRVKMMITKRTQK